VKIVAGLVCFWSLLELQRDFGFLLEAQPGLTQGMLLKLSVTVLGVVGLWKGWRVGYACLVGWCVQGILMSVGDWQGQGASLNSGVSLLLRFVLLGWFVWRRILRKEV